MVAAFDHLAFVLVAGLDVTRRAAFYTSFAKYPTELVEHVAIALRAPDGDLRRTVFPHSNADLIGVLREANELATSQAAFKRAAGKDWAYRGYSDARTWAFIREGHMWEDWQGV